MPRLDTSNSLVVIVVTVIIVAAITLPFVVWLWDQVITHDPYEPTPPEDEG